MPDVSLLADAAANDPQLWPDFLAICDCGGRLAGTESERKAFALLLERSKAATGKPGVSIPVPYAGWQSTSASLELPDGPAACNPLLRSIATQADGLTAEVIDLGRGTPEEFAAHRSDIRGRIVLVRHELMFAAGTIHRRRKYLAAVEAGAVGFLIAGPVRGQLVAGSSGRQEGSGIPAAGIAPETARRLRRTARGYPIATLHIATEEYPAETQTLVFDIPGQKDEWIVLSAHVDGHALGESAMDNATGLACVLAASRALAQTAGSRRRGIRLAFFSVEEWALTGSAQYAASLSQGQRAAVALNVNLDSVGGSPNLSALTSGFSGVEPFLLKVAESAGIGLRTVRPLMENSDHANFARAGIPAFRLVAGYDEPNANLRLVLTPGDRRETVAEDELRQAARLATAIVAAACDASPAEAADWRSGTKQG